jgi:hypothetical protein
MYKQTLKLALVFCALIVGVTNAMAQGESDSHAETRKLLLRLERSHDEKYLKKVFEQADSRKTDLKKALYDEDQKVSLNAQVVIKYLAEPELLLALDEWVEFRKAKFDRYWTAPVTLLTEVKFLEGKNGDLTKLVLKNLHPNEKDWWAKVLATNKKYGTVLIEVVCGEIFTEGWHVVIRKEDGKWRLLSHSLVWQS